MRNLFDGHPDFFAIPMESHFFQNIRYWVSYYQRRTRPEKLGFDQMKDNMCKWVEHMNVSSDQVADNFTKGKWDLELFRKVIYSENVDDHRSLSDLYVKAIHHSLFQAPIAKDVEFVEKSVENAEFAIQWNQLYPQARFIHILRNPYSNFVSFRKYITKKGFPFLKPIVFSMYNSYYYLFKNLNLLENYKVVRYEDLIAEPERIMREVAEFLGVEYQSSLVYPTLFGDSWAGNSISKVEYTKISPMNLDKWKKSITDFEIHLVNELFCQVLERFGFEKLTPRHSKYFPAKKEGLKTYLLNRALWRIMPKF